MVFSDDLWKVASICNAEREVAGKLCICIKKASPKNHTVINKV
jgi:hypothetical protein